MKTLASFKSIPVNRWVLWVGAGISFSSPSGLPGGKELTEYILENVCGKKEKNRILGIWEKIKGAFPYKNVSITVSSIPRLESILDVVADVETKITNIDYSFFGGFKSFLSAPYNEQHVCLAKLVALGATIITSNFDLCIEKAYDDFFASKHKLIQTSIGSLIVYRTQNIKTKGKIIHCHGTADDLHTMGATLQIIKNGFSPSVKRYLTKTIKHSKIIAFIGYSFSDAFDVNPYFENISENYFSHHIAVFYQHESPNGIKITTMPNNIAQLLKCFSSQIYDTGPTDKYISELAENKFILSGDFDWRTNFQKEANLTHAKEIAPFLICKMSNFLGFGLLRISKTAYIKSLSFRRYYPNNEFHDTLTVSLRRLHIKFLEKYHNSKKEKIYYGKSEGPDLLGFYYGQGDYESALNYAASINEIVKEVSSTKKILNWRYYTSMSVYCRPIIQRNLLQLNQYSLTNDDKNKIDQYMPILDLLGNRSLQNVVSINQGATALRFRLLFSALRYGYDDLDTEKKIFYLYGESSSIEGYISAFRDIAVKNFFLYRIHKDRLSRNKSVQFAFSSLRLSFIVGHISGFIRALKLLLFLLFSIFTVATKKILYKLYPYP